MATNILLATPSPGALAPFAAAINADADVKLIRAASAEEALEMAERSRPELVIFDERIRDLEPLEFIRRMIGLDASVYVACISGLEAAEFHERFEGLGVLAQLSPQAGAKQAKALLEQLASLKAQMSGMGAGAAN